MNSGTDRVGGTSAAGSAQLAREESVDMIEDSQDEAGPDDAPGSFTPEDISEGMMVDRLVQQEGSGKGKGRARNQDLVVDIPLEPSDDNFHDDASIHGHQQQGGSADGGEQVEVPVKKRLGRPKGSSDGPNVDKGKRGRPKGTKNKNGTKAERDRAERELMGLEPEGPKKRGRPVGSKNKTVSKKLKVVEEPEIDLQVPVIDDSGEAEDSAASRLAAQYLSSPVNSVNGYPVLALDHSYAIDSSL